MVKIDHYMVDYVDNDGKVAFANDSHIHSLTKAKALASKFSRSHDTGAYVVAFTSEGADAGRFVACGHISFFDGRPGDTDGQVI